MEALVGQLRSNLDSRETPLDVQAILESCLDLFSSYQRDEFSGRDLAFLELLLATIIKPLFAQNPTPSPYDIRFGETPKSKWQSASWSVGLLRWILQQYDTIEDQVPKRGFDSHFPLLVPPILTLLDVDDVVQRTAGFELLENLCQNIVRRESAILARTGFTKVFEDTLGHSIMLLPSLTPEDQSLEILGSLYPAYRALVKASSFPSGRTIAAMDADNPGSRPFTKQKSPSQNVDPGKSTRAMLDRILRNGLLAAYYHASDHVQIATLLVTEMSQVIAMMGASSAKYLSELLPILRSILSDPFGTAHQPLLISAIALMRQLILHCWPRIAEVWFDECARTIIGLWLLLSEDDDRTTKEVKQDTKAVMELLLQLKDPAVAREYVCCLEAEIPEGLLFNAG